MRICACLLLGLLAVPAAAQSAEEPAIGWACQEGKVMPDHRRALLQAPELDAQGKPLPGGNYFVIYQDRPDGMIETVVSWYRQGDTLDLSAVKVEPAGPNPFAPEFARALYAELLAGLRRRLADPVHLCTPLHPPPEDDPGAIVVS